MRCSGCNGCLIAGIRVSRYADPGVIGENTLETFAHFRSSIGDNHLPCMK